ncbi:MAG: hypothetical protein IPK22_13475 [Verrucomicrobiaceae bacterium]|nr:hypothetical protein [Verrucomicrobiaceae bacterium]
MKRILKLLGIGYLAVAFLFCTGDLVKKYGITGAMAGGDAGSDVGDFVSIYRALAWPLRLLSGGKETEKWGKQADEAMERVQGARLALHDIITFNGPVRRSAERGLTALDGIDENELAKVHPDFPSWIQRMKGVCRRVVDATPEAPATNVLEDVNAFEEWYGTKLKDHVGKQLGW